MKLKDVFGVEKKPIKTVQKQINYRPYKASKFYKKGKSNGGRRPMDIKPRFKQKVPPSIKADGE